MQRWVAVSFVETVFAVEVVCAKHAVAVGSSDVIMDFWVKGPVAVNLEQNQDY